jgi:hypothetical protein
VIAAVIGAPVTGEVQPLVSDPEITETLMELMLEIRKANT